MSTVVEDDERIAERLDGEAPPQAEAHAEEEVDLTARRRHRPFTTTLPAGNKEDDLHEEEDTKGGGSKLRRLAFMAVGFLVFVAVVVGVLFFFLGGNGNTTQLQAGGQPLRPGEAQAQEQSRREAEKVLKAVTESATAPAPTNGTGGSGVGDLSAPVSPDPLAATGYAPNSPSPYAPGTQPAGTTAGTPATGTTGATTGGDGGNVGGTGVPGAVAGALTSARPSNAPVGGSFYFYAREPRQLATQPPAEGERAGRTPSTAPPSGGAVDTVPVKPTFGATLPVRLIDSVMTLRDGGIVRLETTRAVSGAGGWTLPRGTVVVARLAGGNNDRAFLNVFGVIDAASNRLVNVGGEVKGSDGAQGIRGERKRVGSRWAAAANKGGSLLTAFLLGRGGGGFLPQPSEVGVPQPNSQNANIDFVYVRAGAQGFVLVTDLPEAVEGRDAATLNASGELSSDELTRLLTDGTPAQIRAALPRMNPELRRLAETVLSQEAQTPIGGNK